MTRETRAQGLAHGRARAVVFARHHAFAVAHRATPLVDADARAQTLSGGARDAPIILRVALPARQTRISAGRIGREGRLGADARSRRDVLRGLACAPVAAARHERERDQLGVPNRAHNASAKRSAARLTVSAMRSRMLRGRSKLT